MRTVNDCPTGKSLRFIGIDVKAFSEKYPTSVFQKYVVLSALSRFRSEGRFAIVTNVGSGTRRSRETSAQPWTAKPCGPGAPTLASSLPR
jgi:hypothetical protein